MNELSTEVQAKETHEKAVGYFKIFEQYGYKFIMEVKKIRDDRYYKELGFSSFDEYCNNAWGFSRRWVDTKIQSASQLKESDFEKYTSQFGQQKTFLLATMEDEQREQAINEGVPTEQGNKPIDEATQKEISYYKKEKESAEKLADRNYNWWNSAVRQAEQAKKSEQIMQKQLEESENKEPEIVEKEVVPVDYHKLKGGYEAAQRLKDRYEEENKQLREELKKASVSVKENGDDSKKQELKKKEERLKNKVDEYDKLYDIQCNLEQIISAISPKIHAIKTDFVKNEYGIIDDFESTLNEVIKVCENAKGKLPNKNIIEGEIVND